MGHVPHPALWRMCAPGVLSYCLVLQVCDCRISAHVLIRHELLDAVGVHVHVYLTAQGANFGADTVSNFALHAVARVRSVGVFLEGEGLTDDGAHLNGLTVVAQANTVRAGGLNQVGTNLSDGHYGHAGFQGEAGDTNLGAVAASVGAAGASG